MKLCRHRRGSRRTQGAEVACLAAGQGLERAAVILRNVGGHAGHLPGGGTGGPFPGPPIPPGRSRLSLPFIPSRLPTTARLSGTDIILSQWIL